MREVRSVSRGFPGRVHARRRLLTASPHDPDVGRLQSPSEVLEATTSKPSAREPVKLGVGLATGQTQHSRVRLRVWIGRRRRSAPVDLIAIQPERSGGQGRPVRAERSESRSGLLDGWGGGGWEESGAAEMQSGRDRMGCGARWRLVVRRPRPRRGSLKLSDGRSLLRRTPSGSGASFSRDAIVGVQLSRLRAAIRRHGLAGRKAHRQGRW
jgi:hypothetical protein